VARVERFEDLEVWKASRELVRAIYGATWGSAFSRDAGLRGQLGRGWATPYSSGLRPTRTWSWR